MFTRSCTGLIAAAVALLGLPVLAGTATAQEVPVPPAPTPTVTADALPTVQVNGVVWDQVVAGGTVYVTGRFTSARPAGSPVGTNETPRANLLAYDLATGVLVQGWAPALNAQGLVLDASADGSTIYVGGDFTSVGGVTRSRVAALDALTGALRPFNPVASTTVRAIDVDGSAVYLGGGFTSMGGQPRSRIAVVDAASGALRPFAPHLDADVYTLVVPPGSGRVVAGGRFQYAGVSSTVRQEVRGLAVFSTADAALQPWAAYGRFPNYGPNSAIYSLSTDGAQVFGTAYDFGGPSPFEGSFAADLATGTVNWVNGCKGDTYASYPVGGVLYTVGHPHDCGMVRGHPQVNPWTFQWAQAETTTPAADGRVNTYGSYSGVAAPELLHWLPTLTPGSFTGQSQAGWSVAGSGRYVVLGGEFPTVNGQPQQGLTRFALPGTQPALQGRQGPQANTSTNLKPAVVTLDPGTVRVSWQAAWDRDDRGLKYEVLSGNTVNSSTVLATLTRESAWWNRPQMSFTESLAPGTARNYRIRVTDAAGNQIVSNATPFTAGADAPSPSAYADAVRADAPSSWWRLGEPSGAAGYDWVGATDLVVESAAQRGVPGGAGDGTAATRFPGSGTAPAATAGTPSAVPQTLTVEAWVSTTSTRGGKIVGFGNSATGASSSYDRHLYLTDAGRVAWGVFSGRISTLTSPQPVNDGQWHHVVGTLGPNGQALYVDGRRVGLDAGTTSAPSYDGWWRVGGDSLGGWPDRPSSDALAGDIDEVAVYPAALSAARVGAHYAASGRTVTVAPRPTDAYGAAVYDSEPALYWRFGETTGTTAADAARDTASPGTYWNGPVQGVPGRIGTGAAFDGLDDVVSTSQSLTGPTTYSQELWFSTTTTRGGKIIGFGNAASGRSGSYDRHVYMLSDGRLRFGVYPGRAVVVDSPRAYNDGAWHHLVTTQGADGMRLYVDGELVGSDPQTGQQAYTGHWRVGGDATWGGAASDWFAGSLDEVAVYPSVLTPQQVAAHFTAGGGVVDLPPTAAFTATPDRLAVSVDGSASTDDTAVVSWAWDFGDGTTATGPTAAHTYAQPGTYPVTLVVTDARGRTGTSTQQVAVASNAAPTAAFTSAAAGLRIDVDGSGSLDADGSVATWAWDFGDGATGSGTTASHTYAVAGGYDVKLTVTDDAGAQATTTSRVTVAATNAPPTAAFTASATGLGVAFDAGTSSDPDGSVASFAWDFGDGATGTGVTATRTYAGAGSYRVRLTVTDDRGATATAERTVTVTAPAAAAFATDAFGRTLATGLGTADTGGAWTLSDAAADYAVADGRGRIRVAAGRQPAAFLNAVAQRDVEVVTTVAVDRVQTGGGTYYSTALRRSGGNEYRFKLRFLANGSLTGQFVTVVAGTERAIGPLVTISGTTFGPGTPLSVVVRATGTGSTALAATVWPAGAARPAAPQVTLTDTTAQLQGPGAVGVLAYLSSSATNGPVFVTVDDLVVRAPVG